jgi:hypothetical protein
LNTRKKENVKRKKIPILRFLLVFILFVFLGIKFYPYGFNEKFLSPKKPLLQNSFKYQLIRNDKLWKWDRLVLIDTLLDDYDLGDFPYDVIMSSFFEMRSMGCNNNIRIDLYSQKLNFLDSVNVKWKPRVFNVRCEKIKKTYVNSRTFSDWFSWKGVKKGAYCWSTASQVNVIGVRKRPGVGWRGYRMYPGYSIINPDSSRVKELSKDYLLLEFWAGVELEISNFDRTVSKIKIGSTIYSGAKIAFSKSIDSPVEMRVLLNGIPMSYDDYLKKEQCISPDTVYSWISDVPYVLPERVMTDSINNTDKVNGAKTD